MKIEIVVYKESGKWYASEIVEHENDIPMYKDEFKELIRKNIPARLGEGFIITRDVDNRPGFHEALWRYNEIF